MKKAGDLTFLAPRDFLQEGEEIYLCYGPHVNRTLFVEYGFINELLEPTTALDELNGEVDVQDILERLFEDRGALGTWMKSVLEDNGYWGYVILFGFTLRFSQISRQSVTGHCITPLALHTRPIV
jgi:hypothetical protein